MSIVRENQFRKIYDSKGFKDVLSHKPVKFPYLVDIELTNNCNLKCLFCPAAQAMTREQGFMPSEVFKKVVDECADHNTPIRFIRWGEPFLHPKVIDFIKYVKKKGLLLHITNNGLVINEKQMKAVINLDVDSLIFSMQGATKKEYEVVRDNKQYDKLKENIETFMMLRGEKEKPFVQVTSTMLDDKEEDIEKFKEQWGKVVDNVGVGETIVFWQPARLTRILKKEYRPCTEIYQKLSVDWNGKASCCCGDHDNLLTIGDVNKSSLSDIWNGDLMRSFRTLLDAGFQRSLTKCSTCKKAYQEF